MYERKNRTEEHRIKNQSNLSVVYYLAGGSIEDGNWLDAWTNVNLIFRSHTDDRKLHITYGRLGLGAELTLNRFSVLQHTKNRI